MESESGRQWIVIIVLVLLGIGIALFFASKATELNAEDQWAMDMQRVAVEQADMIERQQAEVEMLRAQLEDERRRR